MKNKGKTTITAYQEYQASGSSGDMYNNTPSTDKNFLYQSSVQTDPFASFGGEEDDPYMGTRTTMSMAKKGQNKNYGNITATKGTGEKDHQACCGPNGNCNTF